MKHRLSGDQVQRLNALVNAHPNLRGIEDAVRFCIEICTNEVYADAAGEIAAWHEARKKAWEKRRAQMKNPVRRLNRPAIPTPPPRGRPDEVAELIAKYDHAARARPKAPSPVPSSSPPSSPEGGHTVANGDGDGASSAESSDSSGGASS